MVGNAVLATRQLCRERNVAGFFMHYQTAIASFQMSSTIFSRDQEGRVLLGVFVPSSSGPGWLETLMYGKYQEMQVNFPEVIKPHFGKIEKGERKTYTHLKKLVS